MHNIVYLQDVEARKQYAWDASWCQNISVPTLLCWTSHDPTSTVEESFGLQAIIPNSELAVIDEAGHWPQWEKVEEFNRVLISYFLNNIVEFELINK